MTERVPLVDLGAQHAALAPEMSGLFADVLRTGAFVGGPDVAAFEAELAAACGAHHAVAVGNGTDAIRLAITALGIGPGDEVITVSHTFAGTAEGIAHAGATPVFVDVDLVTGTMDPAAAAAAVGPRTAAILPVHLYGRPADMAPLLDLAGRHGIAVVEDACQAHGATWRGQPAGSIGDAGCFSFYPTKNLGACGDGGAITTRSGEVAARLRRLRDHGSPEKYRHAEIGWNSRLDTLQAAVLRVKLPHLSGWVQQRQAHAEAYRRALADVPGLVLPAPDGGPDAIRSAYHLFAVRTADRIAVRERLAAAGVETGVHYPVPLHHQPAFRTGHDLPATDRWAQTVITLPMFPELTAAQRDRVGAALTEACAASAPQPLASRFA